MIVKAYPGVPLYGDSKYRNKQCPSEDLEQITFINTIKSTHQETYGKIILHIENEGQLRNGQFHSIMKRKAKGSLNKGASDILIPGNPCFVLELKKQDRTQSDITQEQLDYLYAAKEAGSFVCIALGHEAAMNAFNDWLKLLNKC